MKWQLALPFVLHAPLLVAAWAKPAQATDFHVLEAHGGYELHWSGPQDGHATYGLGYTWDVFITHPTLRGAELGLRVDMLQCPSCDRELDGGATVATALVSFWKDDLSTVTFYAGGGVGAGYSRQTGAAFGEGEAQAALQIRGIYSGLWFRPALFAGASGALDGYLSLGLRLTVGYSPNHGEPTRERPAVRSPAPSGSCAPPENAQVSAGSETWVIPNCFRPAVVARLDGRDIECTNANGGLSMQVGRAHAGTSQRLEIDIAGGTFQVTLWRE